MQPESKFNCQHSTTDTIMTDVNLQLPESERANKRRNLPNKLLIAAIWVDFPKGIYSEIGERGPHLTKYFSSRNKVSS